MRHFCLGFSPLQTFILEETMLLSLFQNRNAWPMKLFCKYSLQHNLHGLKSKQNQHFGISLRGVEHEV
jgi:hypothetical protein